MSANQTKYIDDIADLISDRKQVFIKRNSITQRNSIPENGKYPLGDNYWYKIRDVICIFADIRGSTKLSAIKHDNRTASVYEYFVGTGVRIFHYFGASYIDIKGDGFFALFNSNEALRSLASAVTFKTFCSSEFKPKIKESIKNINIGFHMGGDQKTVMVKQIGLRDAEGRDSRKNEVWAGKPINMAVKLASKTIDNEFLISERYFNNFNNEELVVKTCGCVDGIDKGEKSELWSALDVSEDNNFDFNTAYKLKSNWCENHGKEWCENILGLDK